MGSHYIPVGKIKIDKDILDIVCPAAGYGETPPPPAIYCPANGYIPEPGEEYEPPIDIGSANPEEIILLCSNAGLKQVRAKIYTTGSSYYLDVYDETENLIETTSAQSSGGVFTYYFPPSYTYLVIKIKLTTAGHSFTSYNNYTTFYQGNYPILEAKFNTPGLTTLMRSFQGIKSFRKITFESSLDSLTSMKAMFASSGIRTFTFPESLPSLSDVSYMFDASMVERIDMSPISFPNDVDFSFFAANTPLLYKCIFPSSLPEVTSLNNCFKGSDIQVIIMPTSAPKVVDYTNFCYECLNLKVEITVPESTFCTSLSRMFFTCKKLPKLKFEGNFSACTNITEMCKDCLLLEELEMPRELGDIGGVNYTHVDGADNIKIYRYPDYIAGGQVYLRNGYTSEIVEQIYGEGESGDNSHIQFFNTRPFLSVINLPKLKCSQFVIGDTYSTVGLAPVTEVNIDWAGSSWSSSFSPTIQIHGNLDSAELNRIYNLLPDVSGLVGTFRIRATLAPGFSSSNYSIAEAKGWYVYT